MSQFAPGDKVRLKAGGPEMVVDHIDKIYGVTCSYWNTKKNAKEQTSCEEASLEKIGAPLGADARTLATRVEALEARVKALEEGTVKGIKINGQNPG
jgi:uncharacterized protein YodC (DUF2158 family)